MGANTSRTPLAAAAGTALLLASALGHLTAQPVDGLRAVPSPVEGQTPAPQGPAAGGRSGGRGSATGAAVFTAADTNKDGSLTRDELKATFDKWYSESDTGKTGSITAAQLAAGLSAALPAPPPNPGGPPPETCGGRSLNPQV